MSDDDMVLVRRDDLRAVVSHAPMAWQGVPAHNRLCIAVNAEAATVEEQWRIVGADGGEDTAQSLEDGLEWARSFDTCYPDSAPHRVEQRSRFTVVGPWTTQETP